MNDEKDPGKKQPGNSNLSTPESRQLITVPVEYIPFGNPEENEVDLLELLAVILKRKWLIAAVAAAFVSLALLYIFLLAKPFYETKATLEIGHHLAQKSDGTLVPEYFASANVVKHYLEVKYDTAGKYRPRGTRSFIDKISIPRRAKGFFTITALGPDNQSAIKELEKPANDIIARHRTNYDSVLHKKQIEIKQLESQVNYDLNRTLSQLETNLKLLKTVQRKKIEDKILFLKTREIPAIKQKIKESEQEIGKKEGAAEKMRQKLQALVKQDAAMATMAAMQISSLQNDIARLRLNIIDYQSKIQKIEDETIPNFKAEKKQLLEEVIPAKQSEIKKMQDITIPKRQDQIKQLTLFMQPPYLEMTKIVGQVYTHDYPVKPRKLLLVAVAGLTGLMLGIFLSLFLERKKRQARDENAPC